MVYVIHHMIALKNQQIAQSGILIFASKNRQALEMLDLSFGDFPENHLFFVISNEKPQKRELHFGGHAGRV